MSNEHVERRTGQRYLRPGGKTISTLVSRIGDAWKFSPPDSNGDEIVSDSWVAGNWTLLSPAPSSRLQGSADGRSWSDCTGGSCGHVMHREKAGAVCRNYGPTDRDDLSCVVCGMAREQHVIPSLESKPAETAKCPHGHVHHCADCDIARAIAASKPPAQEAPKPVFRLLADSKVLSFATAAEREAASAAYVAWTRAQSGTPYAGPERMPKPDLAHTCELGGDVAL